MTPEHAAEGLLALGPLTPAEFLLYTGWDQEKADAVLRRLIAMRVVVVRIAENQHGRRYWLAREIVPPQRKKPPAPIRLPVTNVVDFSGRRRHRIAR